MNNWYSITNKSDSDAEICIYDEIGLFGITAKDFLSELKSVGQRKIKLRINSPGGEVFDGLAIYNRLSEHAPGVEVCIDGIAASMASVIAMVGAPIKMADNALMMLHNPSGLCIGNSDDMRELADMLDKVRGSLTRAYEKKSGKTADEIGTMMDAETWLNSSEAKEMGFIDEITGANKIAAKFDKLKFEGKLQEREKLIDGQRNSDTPNAMPEPTKSAAEIELEKIEAKKVSDAKAAADKAIRDKAVIDERQRVTDIRAWASDVAKVQNIDLTDTVDKFIADGKSLAEFKDHVITTTFKAMPIVTPTDANGAAGNTMTREAFAKLTPFNQSDFCRKGGKIIDAAQ